MRNLYRILFRECECCGHSWNTNIKMELRGIECESVDWIHQPCGRDMNWAVVNTLRCNNLKLCVMLNVNVSTVHIYRTYYHDYH
jgi:hypothetical protein